MLYAMFTLARHSCYPDSAMPHANAVHININASWKDALKEEIEKPYFKHLMQFVKHAYRTKTVYPPPKEIFRAFDATPFNKVKAVIIGQDPYHGAHQANGLCFSVNKGVRQPPSLQNIFKEIRRDAGIPIPTSGNLQHWAEQGVLLLNAALTVEGGKAGSHQHRGWEKCTNAAIKALSDKREHLAFLLWGAYAKSKMPLIDAKKHLILAAAHPSPLSANKGFFGCRHFSKANTYLKTHGKTPIDWSVPESARVHKRRSD